MANRHKILDAEAEEAEEHGLLLNELTETDVTPDERIQMIEEAAYYRAKQRGFHGDESLRDWFEAEAIVDAMLERVVIGQTEKGHRS